MKKTLAVILSILMVLSVTPLFGMAAEKTVEPASGYVSYDSAGFAPYVTQRKAQKSP